VLLQRGSISQFSQNKTLKTKAKLDLCMEEFHAKGRIVEKVKDFCIQKGKESPSECLESL